MVYIPKEKYLHSSDSRTQGQHRFFQERIQDENYKNSFFPRTVRDWNQLPARVVSATSMEELRSFYLSIFTGSLIHEHYTRECEFGNFDKIKNKKHKKKKKNTKKHQKCPKIVPGKTGPPFTGACALLEITPLGVSTLSNSAPSPCPAFH